MSLTVRRQSSVVRLLPFVDRRRRYASWLGVMLFWGSVDGRSGRIVRVQGLGQHHERRNKDCPRPISEGPSRDEGWCEVTLISQECATRTTECYRCGEPADVELVSDTQDSQHAMPLCYDCERSELEQASPLMILAANLARGLSGLSR